jgi:hypothetical protein
VESSEIGGLKCFTDKGKKALLMDFVFEKMTTEIWLNV